MSDKPTGLTLYQKLARRLKRISLLEEDLENAHAIIRSRDLTITQLKLRLDERADKKELE